MPALMDGSRENDLKVKTDPSSALYYGNVFRGRSLGPADDVKLDAGALVKRFEAFSLDRGKVNEHVVPFVPGDEAKTLVGVEPLDSSLSHFTLLLCFLFP